MHDSEFVHNIVIKLKSVQGMQAIVLGGSWASGTQRPDSDIDLGLYYSADRLLDIQQVRNIAIELNDIPNPVVTDLGEWGCWVNGGAWLTIQGQHVDFLYRNIDFVATIIDDCNEGKIQSDYWQQPPYGFHSYIYCAETNICKILYDPNATIQTLKTKVAHRKRARKPPAFMRGFMTIPSPLNVQLSTSSSGLPNAPFKSQKNQQTCILMVPPHTGGHNLHDNEEAGTATSYSRGKWGPCGTLSGG